MSTEDMPDTSTDKPLRISRRESLQWLGIMLTGNLVAAIPSSARADSATAGDAGHWPSLKLPAVTANGYGQDPDLISLNTGPWPRTLADHELATVRILAAIIIPREGDVPSAADLQVEEVVDEWISAPYDAQRRDRMPVVSLLHWVDDESAMRFNRPFANLGQQQRLQIVDDIAWLDTADEFRRPAHAFDRLRSIVVAAYYCTAEGSADLGYMGGKVIAGDYPGPSEEAARHLRQVLQSLDLDEIADPALAYRAAP